MGNLEDTRIGLEVDTSAVAPALDEVPDAVDDTVDEVDSRWSKIGPVLAGGAKVAGAAAGAALIAGAIEGIDREAGSDKIAAQLRLDPAQQRAAGDVAGRQFAGAYADSFEQAETAAATVGDLLTGFDDGGALDRITNKALNYATAFDEDVTDAVGKARQLITDGLAPDADAAFDLMVAAAQDVPAHLRGEATDALTEYSKHLGALGFTGAEAVALISQADDQFTLDKTGDALKEVTAIATSGSDASVAALQSLGLSADHMANNLLAGGETARTSFGQLVDGLRAIEDPSEQAAAAVALFGEPMNDMGTDRIPAFLDSLDQVGGAAGDLTGRAVELGDVLNDNTKASVQATANSITEWIVGLTEADGWVGTVSTNLGGLAVAAQPVAPMMTGLGLVFREQMGSIGSAVASGASKVGSGLMSAGKSAGNLAVTVASSAGSMIASGAKWVAAQTVQAAKATASMAVTAGKFVAHYAKMGVASLVNAAKMAASWVIAMGPVGWVIAGVVALVALIVANWDKVKEWTSKAWSWVSDKVSGVWRAITGFVSSGVDRVVTFARELPGRLMDGIKSLGTTVLDFIVKYHPAAILARKAAELWPTVRTFFTELPGKILDAIGDLHGDLMDKGVDVVRGLWDGIKSMGSWLADKITGFVTDRIPGPIARALGISSPSKVAAALGQEVPAGLAMGMRSEAGDVVSAAERIAQAAVPSVGSIDASVSAAYGSGQQRPTRTGPAVHIENVNLHDELDMESLSRRLGSQLAKA